jgi:hypothetical protein
MINRHLLCLTVEIALPKHAKVGPEHGKSVLRIRIRDPVPF